MNKIWILIFLSAICAACSQHKANEAKTVLIDGGIQDEDIETLNGAVREIVTGDSLTLKNFNHIYFDRKGVMLRANAKYIGYEDTLYRKVTYRSKSNKAGKITEINADYVNYPDKCGCKGKLKWTFDSTGRITEFVSDKHSFDSYIKYKYDTTGRIQYKDSWGKLDVPDRYVCTYDANNKLIQLEHYQVGWNKEPANFLSKTRFEYLELDSHNNWIKKREYTTRFDPYLNTPNVIYPKSRHDTIINGKTYTSTKQMQNNYTITRQITYY